MTEKIQNKALLNIWNETTCIHYPQKLSYKLPTTEVEYFRIHQPMRTSCLSRTFKKFVCVSVFCVHPIHDNARKNTKHKLFCKEGMKQLVYIILGNVSKNCRQQKLDI